MTGPAIPDQDPSPTRPDAETPSPEAAQRAHPEPTTAPYIRRTAIAVLLVVVMVPVILTASGGMELLAQSILFHFTNAQPPISVEEVKPPAPVAKALDGFTFSSSEFHPDRLYHPYFGAPIEPLKPSRTIERLVPPFRELLELYIQRQGQDDNFTIRLYDKRDGRVLELFVLEEQRQAYERQGRADWAYVDRLRKEQTRRLVEQYSKRGLPKDAVGAKWGRANQVREARERDVPFIEYEMRLARYLGLSLLVTEIGTVETFNDDRLVSPVGARGRYQMMPYILRQQGITHYRLLTAYGKKIDVIEEWHPLLTMEPAFRLLRGYVNAVGHEIPGLSAYHTGPGNLFKLFQLFLTEESDLLSANTTVMDAYAWAVTEGYDRISSQTSFKSYSRGYVASGYGALRATDNVPVDTTQTFRAERVQLQPERSIYLSELLGTLDESGAMLYWGPHTSSLSLYERFRHLNPHFKLPPGDADGGVPRAGDVRLVARVDRAPVRFFLPLNASAVLYRKGVHVLDDAATFRFDGNTYRLPEPGVRTPADIAYEDLIRDIKYFGFTQDNRQRLEILTDAFERMAAQDPSHYRLTQLDVIKTHRQLWRFSGWEKLAATTQAAKGWLRMPVRPPQQLQKLPVRPPVPRAER